MNLFGEFKKNVINLLELNYSNKISIRMSAYTESLSLPLARTITYHFRKNHS